MAVHVHVWTEGSTLVLQCDRCGAVELHPKEAMPRIDRELYAALLSLEAPLRVAAGFLMEPWVPSEGPGMRKDMQEAIVGQIGEHLARLDAARAPDGAASSPVVTVSEGGQLVAQRWTRRPAPLLNYAIAQMNALREAKDGAYSERDQCVALIARMAHALGYRVGLGEHDPNDALWEKDWRTIVYVELPTGQLSWHIHDSERHLFEWMPAYIGVWDGHSTPEKYDRMARYLERQDQRLRAALRVAEVARGNMDDNRTRRELHNAIADLDALGKSRMPEDKRR